MPMGTKENDRSFRELSLSQPLKSVLQRYQYLKDLYDITLEQFYHTDNGFQAFFNRYEMLCMIARNRHPAIRNFNHGHVVDTLCIFRNLGGRTRAEYKTVLDQDIGNTEQSNSVYILMDLAASMWSLVTIGTSPGLLSYSEPVMWEDNMAFTDLVNVCFPSPISNDIVKLPQSFTAAHLEKIAGIQVRWTDNLADHLLLRDDDTKVMLFHHVSLLRADAVGLNAIPPHLADETVRTISLLIPPSLGKANPWFQSEQKRHSLDAQAGLCGRLNSSQRQIEKFYFWRERLVLLKRTYDDTEPKNISQLWWDDRRKTQWFTFWVAVLVFMTTLFFGVIQSVASMVQAWASVKVLKMST